MAVYCPQGRSDRETFQSTRPRRGAITPWQFTNGCHGGRVSIHAPPEGRDLHDGDLTVERLHRDVSIHAPPEGRDGWWAQRQYATYACVSIHAPPEGRDNRYYRYPRAPTQVVMFQSTRPRRGAICCYAILPVSDQEINGRFNPRAPGGARFQSLRPFSRVNSFNPRAPGGARLSRP